VFLSHFDNIALNLVIFRIPRFEFDLEHRLLAVDSAKLAPVLRKDRLQSFGRYARDRYRSTATDGGHIL
jgi:hypothetical protein